ncbi:MAG: Tm-1-like ATP-binding domain-containing protein [Chloroflexi bacterium]|nr:Tm-1-like ATP-binding domain-containing protein [Chloroflexota bacterium]
MPKSIIVIGTLDTKGQEIAFVRDLIAERGHTRLTIRMRKTGDRRSENSHNPELVSKDMLADRLRVRDWIL